MRWALSLLVAGCVPELGDAVVVQGRHVTVHADPAIPICNEAVAVADRFVEDVAALIGVQPPAIDYYLFDGETGCGTNQYAMASCEINGDVYANAWIHFHELAHAVDNTHPPALFVEGFAEAMSWSAKTARAQLPPPADVRLPLESTEFRAGDLHLHYRLGGSFVRYLLERFGMARYHTFARGLVSLSDRITIARAFEQVYEMPLDDVIASWRETDPSTSQMTLPIDLVECGDPLPPDSPDTWLRDKLPPSGCVSGQTKNGTVYTQHARRYGFEVSEPGLFAIQLATAGTSGAALWSCVDGTRYAYTTVANMTPFEIRPLAAGRYALEVFDGVQGWRISRLGERARSCDAAPAFHAPNGDWRIDLHGQRGTWVRIDQDEARQLFVSPKKPVRICTGDCSSQHCRELTTYTTLEHVHERALYLELGDEDPSGPSVVVGSGIGF